MEKKDTKKILVKTFTIIFKLLYYLVISFVCLIALFLMFYIISSQINSKDQNYKPRISIYTIVSPSMTPNINVYDVVINIRPTHPDEIQVGDIITYKSTAATSEGMTITHRVIAKEQLPDGSYEFMTQGDNNTEPDSVYVLFDNIIGKEIMTIPKVGRIQFLIANQKGWLFLLLIPIGIYLIKELLKLLELMGLRKKVEKIVKPKEKKPKQIDHHKQEVLKARIKTDLHKNVARKDSYIRNSEEPDGFLEKYNETIVSVKKSKYNKIEEEPKEVLVEELVEQPVIAPTKVDTDKILPKEEKEEPVIELPKIKTKAVVVNDEYEVLDTEDLDIKIKEYDTNIKKIDKMIKDIDSIQDIPSQKVETEVDDFLQGTKIKVTKIEETKNKRREKITTSKKRRNKPVKTDDITIELGGIISEPNKRLKIERPEGEDIKELRKEAIAKESTPKKKESLKLNPNQVKKINRKPKKDGQKHSSQKESKQLNLNPKNVKKVNRPNKKKTTPPKKERLIRIEKRK